MVDTGAVCSVLPHCSKAQPAGQQLSGADGRSILTWGTIRRLWFGLRTFFVTFFLATVYRPILGLDFMSAHGLLVDPVGRQVLDSKTLKPALQDTHRRRDAALQVCRRPLLHNAVSTVPSGLIHNHRRQRKRQTVTEAQNPTHHRDDGPPCVRQGPPPGSRQAGQGRSRVPRAGGGGHHPPFRFAMVVAAAHGLQERRVMAALQRLSPTQPDNDTRPLPPPQHPRPLQQAARLQVLLLHRLGEGLSTDTDGSPGHRQNGDHHPVRFVRVPLHAFRPLQRRPDLPALHGQPTQTPPLRVLLLEQHHHRSHSLEKHIGHLRQIFTIPSGERPADQPNKVRVRRCHRGVPGTQGRPGQRAAAPAARTGHQ
jgi:hypothetical protein